MKASLEVPGNDRPKGRAATVVLIAADGEWMGRALESELSTNRHLVVRAHNGYDALDSVGRIKPDAIILDLGLRDIGGIEICQRLNRNPSFDPTTPIIVTAAAPVPAATRKAALQAGAWECLVHPIDPDILLLKLQVFMRAKMAVNSAQEESIMDTTTGVLSPKGMEYWAEQLVARAERNHESLACIVLMPSSDSADAQVNAPMMDGFIQKSRTHMRRSDVVGRLADGRLVLLAPDTDEGGVLKFVDRLRKALERSEASAAPMVTDFRAGYCAISDLSAVTVNPAELMRRASKALDHTTLTPARDTMALSFDSLPIH